MNNLITKFFSNRSFFKIGRTLLFVIVIFLAFSSLFRFSYETLVEPVFDLGSMNEKFDFFKNNKDAFDTIFIGSSAVLRDIIPAVYDKENSEYDTQTRSFNFGDSDFKPIQYEKLLRCIFETKPKNLRWVWLSFENLFSRFESTNKIYSLREIYWHDTPNFFLS